MKLNQWARKAEKFVTDNSPAILTAIGVTGTLTTAYLTGKATVKATRLVDELEQDVTWKERCKLVWKLYIPAVGVATLTCASIICANRIGTRRAAAMASAYALTEKAFVEYKDKVVEHIGKDKEEAVRSEIAQERVKQSPVNNTEVIVTGGGDVLCQDAWTGRYFRSDMETMKKAQNDTNHEILNQGYASLTDFYNRLGLERTRESDEVGWNSDKLLELHFTTAISDGNEPCLVMDFDVVPVRNYFRTH